MVIRIYLLLRQKTQTKAQCEPYPTTPSDNQNEAVYTMTKNYLQHLDAVINQEGLNFSDEQLLDKMVMGDIRMKALASFEVSDGQKFGRAIENGYNGKMLQDFNSLVSDIVEVRRKIAALELIHKTLEQKVRRVLLMLTTYKG